MRGTWCIHEGQYGGVRICISNTTSCAHPLSPSTRAHTIDRIQLPPPTPTTPHTHLLWHGGKQLKEQLPHKCTGIVRQVQQPCAHTHELCGELCAWKSLVHKQVPLTRPQQCPVYGVRMWFIVLYALWCCGTYLHIYIFPTYLLHAYTYTYPQSSNLACKNMYMHQHMCNPMCNHPSIQPPTKHPPQNTHITPHQYPPICELQIQHSPFTSMPLSLLVPLVDRCMSLPQPTAGVATSPPPAAPCAHQHA